VSGIPFKPWMNGETIAQKHNSKNIETLLNDEQ
jgi:hypothetical protein